MKYLPLDVKQQSINQSINHFLHPKQTDIWALGITPIKLENLEIVIKNYPDQETAKDLFEGFRDGFKLQFKGPRVAIT